MESSQRNENIQSEEKNKEVKIVIEVKIVKEVKIAKEVKIVKK